MVELSADLDRVRVRLEGRMVSDHAQVWACGATLTDPAHVEAARRLRHEFRQPPDAADGLVRDLADYDRAFARSEEFV